MSDPALFVDDLPTPANPEAPLVAEQLDHQQIIEGARELWKGHLRRKPHGGSTYNMVNLRLCALLIEYIMARAELDFCGDSEAFLIARNPDTILSPFAAFWRLPVPTNGPWKTFAPNLVVEYVSETSPRQLANEKRVAWFEAGTQEVWFLQEETRSLEIWRPGSPFERHQDDVYQGHGLTEGLQVDLNALFGDQ